MSIIRSINIDNTKWLPRDFKQNPDNLLRGVSPQETTFDFHLGEMKVTTPSLGTCNFHGGIHTKYRNSKLQQAFNIIMEHNNNILI